MSRHPLRTLAGATVLAAGPALGQPVTSTWIAPGGGDWWAAANWDPAVVPHNVDGLSFHVLINDDALTDAFAVLADEATITTLRIDPGDAMFISDGGELTIKGPTITNDGLLQIDSANDTSILGIDADTVLAGVGTVILNTLGSVNDTRIQGTFPDTHRLTNQQTIIGSGNIGGGGHLFLTNEGVIDARHVQGGDLLRIAMIGDVDDNLNTGVLQAAAGGELQFRQTRLDSTGGEIRALEGSIVTIYASVIRGAAFSSEDDAEVAVCHQDGLSSTLQNVSNAGLLAINESGELNLRGTVVNDGVIEMRGVEDDTLIMINSAEVVLDGTGVLDMGTSPIVNLNRIDGTFAQENMLVNGPDHAIVGAGTIGWSYGPNLTNLGLIDANVAGATLDVQPVNAGAGNVNQGILQASGGGTLRLDDTTIDNAGGVIRALDGSAVRIMLGVGGGKKLTGGTLATEGSGVIQIVDSSHLSNITNTGTIDQMPNIDVHWAGPWTNDGTYTLIDDGASQSSIVLESDITIEGAGEVVMQKAATPPHRFQSPFNETWTLTNGPDHTIRGSGRIGEFDTGFVNLGTLRADGGQSISIRAHSSIPVENHGLFEAINGSTLQIRDADFSNNTFITDGEIYVEAGSVLSRTGGNGADVNQTGGITTVDGELGADQQVLLQGGLLQGSGTVTTPILDNQAGTVAPGGQAGTLSVDGDYVQAPGAVLGIDVDATGSGADLLDITGTADIAGTLEVGFVDDIAPELCDSFTILAAASVDGEFDLIVSPMPGGLELVPEYADDAVILHVACAGDFNGDCATNTLDFVVFQQLFMQQHPDADCNGDGEFGVLDFVCFQQAFLDGCG